MLTQKGNNQKDSKKSPQILLVEDNLININIAVVMLEDIGYKNVKVAKTGKEALKLFSVKTTDLVILDIGLPDMRGTIVCQKMKALCKNRHIPIIAYTASGDYIRQECMEAGVDGFLEKPVPLEEFNETIRHHLNH